MVSLQRQHVPGGEPLRVVDPTVSSVAASAAMAPRPESLEGVRFAMLDDGKPYAQHFLDSVWKHITDLYDADRADYRKSAPSVTFTEEAYKDMVGRCQVAITAIGD